MPSVPRAQVPRCRTCGAPLPLDLTHSRLVCGACRTEVKVDPALREAMSRYVDESTRLLADELRARWASRFYVQNEAAATTIVFGSVGVAVALTGLFLAWIITPSFGGQLALPYAALLLGTWVVSLASFTRGWWVMFASSAPESPEATRIARCEGCGALQPFVAGAAASTCRHCRGCLLVPAELVTALLEELRTKERVARERDRTALASAESAGDRLVPIAVGLVVVGVPALVVSVVLIGSPGGSSLSRENLALLFAGAFVPAFAVMARATRRAAAARRALESRIRR